MLPEHKIIQITPATGWHATYTNDSGDLDPELNAPVVCFALIEYSYNGKTVQEVRAMTYTDLGIEVEDAVNFAGVLHETEVLAVAKTSR